MVEYKPLLMRMVKYWQCGLGIKGDYRVKKYYRILIFIIIAVVAIFSSSIGTKIETLSPAIQCLAMLAFVFPTCLLLDLISRKKTYKKELEKVL